MGQLYGNKNHFYGVETLHDSNDNQTYIIGYTYTGAIYLYRNFETDDEEEEFKLVESIGGHQGKVMGLQWSSEGSFLVSGSLDQTTRVFGVVGETISIFKFFNLILKVIKFKIGSN